MCRDKDGRRVFTIEGAISIKFSAYQDHAAFEEHRRLAWVGHKGNKIMEKAIASANKSCDDALLSLLITVYYLGKETISFSKSPSLYHLLISIKACIIKELYYNKKARTEFILYISSIIQRTVLHMVKNAKFYGIMIDESPNISFKGHLILFANFVEERMHARAFLGMLRIEYGKKDYTQLYKCFITNIKQ